MPRHRQDRHHCRNGDDRKTGRIRPPADSDQGRTRRRPVAACGPQNGSSPSPHSDLVVTLARTEAGVSCFVLPGWLPDGSRNRLMIQRLKDKAGNRSNASSEVELRGAYARLVGEEGRGIRHAVAMAHLTRMDFAVGSAGLMRHAVAQAAHHVANRRAFQKALIDQPIMANVIADLHLEQTAAAWLAFRVVARGRRA